MSQRLSTTDHNRDMVGRQYIYPVISRRAGGLSIGVNVNTNNACNWRCVYCQVPNLSLGAAPAIDFALLESELRQFLAYVLQGSFYDDYEIAAENRVIKDIAISGNGEPTTAKDFAQLITVIGEVANELGVFPTSKFILITNGSQIHHAHVQAGLQELHKFGGEVWYKLDSASSAGRLRMNNSRQSDQQTLTNLRLAASLCHTKIQTCILNYEGLTMPVAEQDAYLALLNQLKGDANLNEVMLYSLARPSCQPEAAIISAADPQFMQAFATAIRATGFSATCH